MTIARFFAIALAICFLNSCTDSRLSHEDLVLKLEGQSYAWWSYRGSSDKAHYLTAHRLGIFLTGGSDDYTLSRSDLAIPRTYARRSPSEAEHIFGAGIGSLPHYSLSESGRSATLTGVMADGKPGWVRVYAVKPDGTCVAHGGWRKYRFSGALASSTEYRNGVVSGRHWRDLDWSAHGAEEIESFWQNRTPVGTWRIDPKKVKHVVIHFENGSESLKEWYGASGGKKLLLQRWKNGRQTFKGDWVAGGPPKVAYRGAYTSHDLLPDFDPGTTTIAELRRLAARGR